ncbi:uncharacterized protein J8A68_004750 [[Candida] subhashii]|uniref:Uncharacterized protein n=1 Tax=[Candida] subhashii TaxID=561895 RepID=A0A8J5QGH9_9ASCO|nr:uncharacterized protein J8A68_004750 [[Candida] subhashii]KAG7661734.1 hypothetical protein J8A68_004750 [[Candida] subhashii]
MAGLTRSQRAARERVAAAALANANAADAAAGSSSDLVTANAGTQTVDEQTNSPLVQEPSTDEHTPTPHVTTLVPQHQVPQDNTVVAVMSAVSDMTHAITESYRTQHALDMVTRLVAAGQSKPYNGSNKKEVFKVMKDLKATLERFEACKEAPILATEYVALFHQHFAGAAHSMMAAFITRESAKGQISIPTVMEFVEKQLSYPDLYYDLLHDLANFKQITAFPAYKQRFYELVERFETPIEKKLHDHIVRRFADGAFKDNQSYLRAHVKTIDTIPTVNLPQPLALGDANHFGNKGKSSTKTNNQTNTQTDSDQSKSSGSSNNKFGKRKAAGSHDGSKAKKQQHFCKFHKRYVAHTSDECKMGNSVESGPEDFKLWVTFAAISVSNDDTPEYIEVELSGLKPQVALLDSGCTANFIHPELVRREDVRKCDPRPVKCLDGTFLCTVTEYVDLEWQPHFDNLRFYLTKLSPIPIVLGSRVSKKFRPESLKLVDPNLHQHLVSSTSSCDEDILYNNIRLIEETNRLREITSGESVTDAVPLQVKTRFTYNSPDIDSFLKKLFKRFAKYIHNNPITHRVHNKFVHEIELEPFKTFPNRPFYPMKQEHEAELERQIQNFLQLGLVEESHSRFAAPCILVDKPDGSKRLCIDYRELNKITITDKFPLPVIEDLLTVIHDSTYFSKLDLSSGYHQINVAEKDRHKTAFRTRFGLYQWKVMPFGLCNAPATFQRAMNSIFKQYLRKFVVVYLDDILIFSKNKEEHKQHLTKVFEILEEYGLVAKQSKCQFFCSQIQYLGHTISKGRVKITPSKIDAVSGWQFPKSKREMKSALGFASFCRKSIRNFSSIIRPLADWAIRNKRINKTSLVQTFETLKKRLTEAPTLVTPSPDAVYKITTDASDYCTGAVIEKLDSAGKSVGVVAYFSKVMNKHELNYPPREKEFLAIIRVLERHRHLLLGHKIILDTDHESLQYILSHPKPISPKMARWLDFLGEFDIEINYIRGKHNKADALTRRWQDAIQFNAISFPLLTQSLGANFFQECRNHYAKTDRSRETYAILNGEIPVPKSRKRSIKKFSLEDGLLYYHGYDQTGLSSPRLWIPTTELQLHVINQHHSSVSMLHPGLVPTYMELQKYYWWPNMHETVRYFIRHCETCQAIKPSTQLGYGLLHPIPIPTRRWQSITMDFISGFKETQGKNQVLIVVDRLTKRAHFIPCSKNLTAQECASLILNEVIKHHGVPEEIITDRDSLFTSHFWQEFFTDLQTKLKYSTPNHPQTDGQTERTNRTFIQLLRAFSNYRDTLWLDKLPLLEFAYNYRYHSSIKMSPFEADLGYQPLPPHLDANLFDFPERKRKTRANELDLNTKMEHLNFLVSCLQDNLFAAQEEQEKHYNKAHRELLLQPGDKVLLHRNSKIFGYSFRFTKEDELYYGPFAVIKKFEGNDNAYELDLGPAYQSRLVNVKHMRPYQDSLFYKLQPPTTFQGLINAGRARNIEAIRGVDIINRLMALTFKDCAPFHAAIFPAADVRHALHPTYFQELLDQYSLPLQQEPEIYNAVQSLAT